MSLILEALRKSEAERQRGRAPGLFVEQIPASARRHAAPRVWPWLLVGVLVAAGVTWAWWQGRRPDATSNDEVVAAAAPDAATRAAENLPTRAADASLERGHAGEVAPSPSPGTNAASAPAVTPAAPPTVARVDAPIDTRVATPVDAPSRPSIATPIATPADVPVSAPVVTQEAPPPAPTITAAAEENIPGIFSSAPMATVASLSAADRAQLPALKLSMHVYADEPGQRFVILDGQRLGEGATPASGLVLEEIRRDGVVLSVNGQRVLLKRP